MAARQFNSVNASKNNEVYQVTWSGLLNGDTGLPLKMAEYADKTFQVAGTFGAGGSVTMQGCNEDPPVNWWALSNRQGTAMTFTALAGNTSQDRPVWVRPIVTAGDGTTSLVVTAACHRSDISGPG